MPDPLRARHCSEGVTLGLPAWSNDRKALAVGTGDKIDNQAEVLKGKVKETAGRATDDPELEIEGQDDQAKGHVKQAGEKVKDAVKDVFGK
ncbi:MAG: CsbD family protein [Pseudonocardiaceae bacterium]